MQLTLGFVTCLLLTVVLIPGLMRWAPVIGLVDRPDHRKLHNTVIPCTGGLAIYLGFSIASLLWIPLNSTFMSLYVAGFILVLLGIVDDSQGLGYRWKFAGQIVAVIVLLNGGILFDRLPFAPLELRSAWISYPLTFLFLLGSINAINLADGLDGLAAGISLLSLSLIAILAYQTNQTAVLLLSVTLVGALIGFLRYNTHPAQVFMGDTGSQFLGLMLASLSILVTQHPTSPYSAILPLLAMGLPIIDTTIVIALRLREGASPFLADNRHIHHQIMSLGLNSYEVVAIIYVVQIIIVSAAYLLRFDADVTIFTLYSLFAGILLTSLYLLRVSEFSFRHDPAISERIERRNPMLRKAAWYHENSTRVIQLMIAVVFICAFAFVGSDIEKPKNFLLGLSVFLIFMAIYFRRRPQLVSRITVFCAIVFVIYFTSISTQTELMRRAYDAYLIIIFLTLMLAIRMTRRDIFRLDNLDLLVLLLVLTVPQISFRGISDESLGAIIPRLAITLYAAEYIISKKDFNYWILNGSAIMGIILIALVS